MKYNQIDDYAWYSSNSNVQTHEVGTKLPNAWGLFDMSGNVWEWCQDWAQEGSVRMARGGSWSESASRCLSANRCGILPYFGLNDLGFRVATVPSSK